MNYKETIDWLYSFERFGIKLGLERISHICKKLGDPQKNYKVIHVGGTNGKGSVCRFLQSIITLSGYKVGVYTSPHLQHISERMVVNNQRIKEDELASLINKVKPVVDDMLENDNVPTFFEIVTALAFQYFSDKEVDFAVVEVGLGGHYDATNIVDPVVTVITNISLEHENVLGKKISNIALEKAGIIKNGIPVVTAAEGESHKVIEDIAKEKNAPVTTIDDSRWSRIGKDGCRQEFLIKGCLNDYSVKTSLLGGFQGENIALAVSVIELLQMNGVYIPDNSVIDGIAMAVNPGRMELIGSEPFILLDGAHNTAGMQVLVETLRNDFDYDKLVVVLGILSDKDIKSMLSIIVPLADVVVTTKSRNTRACDPSVLKGMIEELNYKNEVVVKDKISDGVEYARSIAKKDGLICVTGSLFTVGEARDCLFKKP